jgi:hypothetical protein
VSESKVKVVSWTPSAIKGRGSTWMLLEVEKRRSSGRMRLENALAIVSVMRWLFE